ncbi:GAF domain-containing protein [Roseomonas sp. CCTCC AB2023176]|uniref:GAF domain-containing protein n=1 Tax=Roseomonas sp. CCTCC AB2023176 TaxID=3342640 RepID=UPI0035DF389B
MPASPEGHEAARLVALRRYEILDASPEPALDALTKLLRVSLGTESALLSLVDETRQWFRASDGFAPPAPSMPRDLAFCSYTMLAPEPVVIADTGADERFAGHPLVTGPPHTRFYAGAPLVTPEGLRIGTVCVLSPDPRPQGLEGREVAMLQAIASAAMDTLETRLRLRRALRRLEKSEAEAEALRASVAQLRRREAVAEGRQKPSGRPGVTPSVSAQILAELRAGALQKEVAWRHGVSLSTVRRIAARGEAGSAGPP